MLGAAEGVAATSFAFLKVRSAGMIGSGRVHHRARPDPLQHQSTTCVATCVGLFLDACCEPRVSSPGSPDEQYRRIAGVRWQGRENIVNREVSIGIESHAC